MCIFIWESSFNPQEPDVSNGNNFQGLNYGFYKPRSKKQQKVIV